MEGFVGEKLSLLSPIDKAWQPTDFLPDLASEDWMEQVQPAFVNLPETSPTNSWSFSSPT